MRDDHLGLLLKAAADGERAAWDQIVERFGDLVWAVARSFRLHPADAADVSQVTWLRLVEHLDRIRDPERLGPWLATTARREAIGLLRRAGRYVLTDVAEQFDHATGEPDPAEAIAAGEREALLWRALATLSERCQQLLRVLMADPPPNYAEVSAAVGIPVGSIGPTRARCLANLRRRLG